MKLIILDRDGVINHDSMNYIKSPQEWLPIKGSLQAVADLTALGFTIAVATNQSGVSRGYYDLETLEKIHGKMCSLIAEKGGCIDKIWYCTHLPSQGCSCRKPEPGMLLNIADYYQVDLSEVYFIGDRVTDIQAGLKAGANPLLIESPMTEVQHLENYPQIERFSSLASLVQAKFHED